MSRPLNTPPALLAAALLVLAAPFLAPLAAQEHPYVLVLTSGETVKAIQKPSIQGKLALVLVWPDGERSTVPVSKIDWPATEKANAGPRPTPTLSSWDRENLKGDASLKGVAKTSKVDDDKATAKSGDYGKIKSKDGTEVVVQSDATGLAADSVLKYVQLTNVVVDRWCDATLTFRNLSTFKVKKIKVYLLIPERRYDGDTDLVQSSTHTLPELMPGQEARLKISVSCYGSQDDRVSVKDITGTTAQAYAAGEVQPWPEGVPTPGPTKATPKKASDSKKG